MPEVYDVYKAELRKLTLPEKCPRCGVDIHSNTITRDDFHNDANDEMCFGIGCGACDFQFALDEDAAPTPNPNHKPGKPLAELQVGDDVIYVGGGWSTRSRVVKVTKATAKFLCVEGFSEKYRRDDGHRTGKSFYSGGSIHQITVEALEEIERAAELTNTINITDTFLAALRRGEVTRENVQAAQKLLTSMGYAK